MSRLRDKESASATRENPNIIRKLGRIERLQSAQHLLDLYYGCAISCRYAIPDALLTSESTHPSLEDIVEKAIALAILEHPLFQVGRINEDSKKPFWVRLDRIDLHDLVEWRTVTESENYQDVLHEILEWQISNKFTHLETRPGWRSVILRSTNSNFVDVVFAWEHTAGDGKSGKLFHESLLACLNCESGENLTEPLKNRSFEIPATALTPPLDHLMKFPISCGYFLSEAWHALVPRPSDFTETTAWSPVHLKPYKTRLSLITVEGNALQVVLEACRRYNTTLTGLVHALALVSMATRLSEDKIRAFGTGTPVCLRRFIQLNPPKDFKLDMEHTVANSVTYWSYTFDKDMVSKVRQQVSDVRTRPKSDVDLEATVWSAAAGVKLELSKKLESGMKNDLMGLVRFVGDWRSYMTDRLKEPRTRSWEISNLGVINGDVQKEKGATGDKRTWSIEHAVFTQSAAVAGPAICMNPITVKGKSLTMTCSWQIEAVDDELAQGFSSDLEAWLNGLGETGRIPFKVDK